MRLGYRATAKRDYRNALVNFRKALQVRPGDRYATVAIDNVSGYAARRGRKLVFIPGIQGAPVNRIGAGTRLYRLSPPPSSITPPRSAQEPPKPPESPSLDNNATPSPEDRPTTSSGEELVTSNSQKCAGDNPCPIALLPNNDRALLTTVAYPKLLFYLPQTSREQINLLLRSTEGNAKTYELTIPAPTASGIVSFDLSALKDAEGKVLPPLEVGKKYKWSLAIVSRENNRPKDLGFEGAIERQQVDPELAKLLQQGSPSDRISLYTVNNFWYDALATLYQERQSRPDDPSLINDWTSLLESIELSSIAKEPLVPCCGAKK
jgi:hypothetical protein